MRALILLLLAFSAHAHDVTCSATDTTPSWNAAVAAAIASPTDKTVNIPAGNCYFATTPAILTLGIQVVGQGKSVTALIRTYSNGEFISIQGQGVGLRNLTVYAGAGTSGGVGVQMLTSDLVGAGGNHVIQDVWVTGAGTWGVGLGAYGAGRTIPPIGIRTITLRGVVVFNATVQAVSLWGCVACEWFGGGAYQGGGTTQVVVIGGTYSQKNRVDADIDWAGATVYAGSLRNP